MKIMLASSDVKSVELSVELSMWETGVWGGGELVSNISQ